MQDSPSISLYQELYPIEKKSGKLIFYKAVHKDEKGKYTSDYDSGFLYKIGETIKEKLADAEEGSCASGIHISHKWWAVNYGRRWKDLALLEVEASPKDIIVCSDCDGKVRASKVKILRAVPREEW